jgi:hypothetical protein
VRQQPVRARMCGFGDKDRRPVTPPPCIRLVVTDVKTGLPVPCKDIDGSFFVLQVDLWNPSGTHGVNVVRASSSSPAGSISTAVVTSYPPEHDRAIVRYDGQAPMFLPGAPGPMMGAPPGYPHPMSRPSMSGPHMIDPYTQQPIGFSPMQQGTPMSLASPAPHQQTTFTRNLIGSLSVNASRLKDPQGEEGFWFVLQDLSVRTEGMFRYVASCRWAQATTNSESRLKTMFINVANPSGGGLNTGSAPVLADVFSDTFQVFSAKKFPGVLESTELSKCFATQGIKIPIRKDPKSDDRDPDDSD